RECGRRPDGRQWGLCRDRVAGGRRHGHDRTFRFVLPAEHRGQRRHHVLGQVLGCRLARARQRGFADADWRQLRRQYRHHRRRSQGASCSGPALPSCPGPAPTISGGSLTVGGSTIVEGGTLTVANGGTLTTTNFGVAGSAVITGAGSSVTVFGQTFIGNFAPASLTISNGGVLNSQG